MEPTDLAVTAGLPYSRRIRVTGAKNVWPTLDQLEVRAQVRASRRPTATLVFNLADHLTATFDGDDLVIDLVMTGEQTREMVDGSYDMVVSDIGTVDARAIRVLYGTVRVSFLLTAAADA